MEQSLSFYLSKKLAKINLKSIAAVQELHAEGATVPFIARYRKEKTGNLDETEIREVISTLETYEEIVKRKAFLIKEIGEQKNLTPEIQARIDVSWDLNELEEIYRPFKKKKKTKATIARDAGLEPLSQWIWDVGHGTLKDSETMEMKAKNFLNLQAGIVSYDLALKGAQDIIVEKLANDPGLRLQVSKSYMEQGYVIAKRAKGYKAHSKFEMYSEFEEPAKSLLDAKSSHRYLAMRRGWQEEELTVDIKSKDDEKLQLAYNQLATTMPDSAVGQYLVQCAKLAFTVYVVPSVVNETHKALKDKADDDAVKVFSENVRKLLLASPFGPTVVLGLDPGLRTGCKVALIDKGGNFISHTVMHILGEEAHGKAVKLFSEVFKQISIEAIAVGNGTAGRETEVFVRKVLKEIGRDTPVVMVNESGASVYSASEIAKEEFPELDLTVRGAISIARRLQDPLAELVKVDPKSIGVGQYQHDVNQASLKKSLDGVVESCVNAVGVDLNTASAPLLSFVSGIGPVLATNIVEFRKKQLFKDRSELLNVPRFSAKVFEQAAGFLRIRGGKVTLDSTGIHPERYAAVRDMGQELGVPITELVGEGAQKLKALREKWKTIIGEYTFDDIVKELEKPGRDPRDPFKVFQFREDLFELKDLKPGLICPGLVTNVTNFGAFVDIGVHQDGLVHISELSHKFVDDPRKVVNPGDQVTVRVLSVDLDKKQLSLTMKIEAAPQVASAPRPSPRPREPRADSRGGTQAGQARGPFQGAGHNGDRPNNRSQQNSHQGPRREAPRSQDQRRGVSMPQKPAAAPFNNPFAALQAVTGNSNKK